MNAECFHWSGAAIPNMAHALGGKLDIIQGNACGNQAGYSINVWRTISIIIRNPLRKCSNSVLLTWAITKTKQIKTWHTIFEKFHPGHKKLFSTLNMPNHSLFFKATQTYSHNVSESVKIWKLYNQIRFHIFICTCAGTNYHHRSIWYIMSTNFANSCCNEFCWILQNNSNSQPLLSCVLVLVRNLSKVIIMRCYKQSKSLTAIKSERRKTCVSESFASRNLTNLI